MKFLKAFWQVLCDLGRASRAAELARNGKIDQAQSFYR